MPNKCFCGSNNSFSDCCEPIIKRENSAITAEQLMRSRYSAYVVIETKYLLESTYPSQQKNFDEADIKAWAIANKWQKLEIISTKKGQINDEVGEVEFKAFYIDSDGTPQMHHENSTFVKEAGKWFYLSGIFNPKNTAQTQNRNDFCACGSGKKYKKCCGK
jgi:SEC-C motif-containing protein